MAETDVEMQLKVWKDLAISKQMLIRAATDALKLDPSCSQDELKVALEAAIKRAIEADVEVAKAQEQAKVAVSTMEKKLADSLKALNIAEASQTGMKAELEKYQQQMVDERANTAKEVAKVKERLADKEQALKTINTALADTPENVLKKMKTLKKQKMDESDARKQAEANANTLRKEKQKLEQTIKEMQAAQDNAATLAEKHRELHTVCEGLHEQLTPLVEDAKSLAAVPPLDSALLESIEKADGQEENKADGKGKGKGKGKR